MAYYSKLRPEVYHICKNCTVGNNMVKGNLRKGKPKPVKGRKKPRLCRICDKLQADKRCTPGIPILPKPKRGAKVKTYYSQERPEIFHMCQNCYLGQNIEEKNLIKNKPPRAGKGKKVRLCKVCTKVCIAGKCITGTPTPAR